MIDRIDNGDKPGTLADAKRVAYKIELATK
jgi:hypothetical protein